MGDYTVLRFTSESMARSALPTSKFFATIAYLRVGSDYWIRTESFQTLDLRIKPEFKLPDGNDFAFEIAYYNHKPMFSKWISKEIFFEKMLELQKELLPEFR